MKRQTRQKCKLIVNVVLTIISLTALVISMVAWFTSNKYAHLHSLEMQVERKEISLVSQPISYLFPCATKIGDESTKEDFDRFCCVTGTYVIKGEGKLIADVTNNDGILGYVLEDNDVTNYYEIIANDLDKQLQSTGKTLATATYSDLRKALRIINTSRLVGTKNAAGNTEIKIVCWAEYEKFESQLNQSYDGVYSFNQIPDLKVNVTFVL